MADTGMNGTVIVVGAGPAGMRASETLVAAGLRPVVIDEGLASGGQIYRRQPAGFVRSPALLYGDDAGRATGLHAMFDGLRPQIDYRPETLAWNLRDDRLHIVSGGVAEAIRFDALILATGATDRLAPIAGWTLPGCYSMGGAQVALKAQACSIGANPIFLGTGPLLYLVASQYVKAGVNVAAVLDTSPFSAQVRALPGLLARPGLLWRGMRLRRALQRSGVPVRNGIEPLAITGDGQVDGVRYRDGGRDAFVAGDAVALGFHLRSETQLADLAGCPFLFDTATRQWRPEADADGRTPSAGVYLAGDGARILGADAAEAAGELAALAVLSDMGGPVDSVRRDTLRTAMARFDRFRAGLATAFPWPAAAVRAVADDVIVCRCEAITAGDLRDAATVKGAPELNRTKALSRVGMGRCQGRYCGQAAAEIVAAARGASLDAVGRLRGQAPVKPLSLATVRGDGL